MVNIPKSAICFAVDRCKLRQLVSMDSMFLLSELQDIQVEFTLFALLPKLFQSGRLFIEINIDCRQLFWLSHSVFNVL